MKQIQELMTQGHADEQSPDYAVTQMSEDIEAIGVHAPTQKFQASEDCSVSLNTAPVSGNLKENLRPPAKCYSMWFSSTQGLGAAQCTVL